MSASLIGGIGGLGVPHDFKDDIESSIYVVLWMTLMYSECSNPTQVPSFLEGVLDPQPHHRVGGFGKADFLKGRTFMDEVQFPGRPALHRLIRDMATLFAARYENPPNETERKQYDALVKKVESDETLLYGHHVYEHDNRQRKLKDHNAALLLFDTALGDHNRWPADDGAIKQDISKKTPSAEKVIKSSWCTTLFLAEINYDHDNEVVMCDGEESEDEDFDLIDTDMSMETIDERGTDTSSERTKSDQMTIDGGSPALRPSVLPSQGSIVQLPQSPDWMHT